MQEKILKLYIMMQMGMAGFLEDFKEEERGASDIVAIILVIVVIIAVATIFRNQLTEIMENIMEKVSTFVNGE